MKRNGFVSTALIYTFFIIFLTLMVYLLSSYANKRILLNSYKEDIKKSFINENIDVTLFYMVWNNETLTYSTEGHAVSFGMRVLVEVRGRELIGFVVDVPTLILLL